MPERDFAGGEFVLTEQRPRMQSRAEVVPLGQGDAVIFAVRQRPVNGTRGSYRVNLRHGGEPCALRPSLHSRNYFPRCAMKRDYSGSGDLFGLSCSHSNGANSSPKAQSFYVNSLLMRVRCSCAILSEILLVAPFRHMSTPGGFRMSVAMTNCGLAGWISDSDGYRYAPVDP